MVFPGFPSIFPAFWALPVPSARLLELLLALGCPVDLRDGAGLTAAHLAAQRGRHDLALLIDGYAEEGCLWGKPRKIMGNSWENHEKSWETHGKIMGKSFKVVKIMGNS